MELPCCSLQRPSLLLCFAPSSAPSAMALRRPSPGPVKPRHRLVALLDPDLAGFARLLASSPVARELAVAPFPDLHHPASSSALTASSLCLLAMAAASPSAGPGRTARPPRQAPVARAHEERSSSSTCACIRSFPPFWSEFAGARAPAALHPRAPPPPARRRTSAARRPSASTYSNSPCDLLFITASCRPCRLRPGSPAARLSVAAASYSCCIVLFAGTSLPQVLLTETLKSSTRSPSPKTTVDVCLVSPGSSSTVSGIHQVPRRRCPSKCDVGTCIAAVAEDSGSENAKFLSAVNHYFHNMSCTTTVARIRQDNVYHDTGDMNIYEMCMTI
nr:uncharacterized protein LOC109764976 [Aegilops tauschii subsp. strangulata]